MQEQHSTQGAGESPRSQTSHLLRLPTELRYAIFTLLIEDYTPPFHDVSALRRSCELWNMAEQRCRRASPPILAVCRQMRHDSITVWTDYLRSSLKFVNKKRELAKTQLAELSSHGDADRAGVRNAHDELLLLTCMAFAASRALWEVREGKRRGRRTAGVRIPAAPKTAATTGWLKAA